MIEKFECLLSESLAVGLGSRVRIGDFGKLPLRSISSSEAVAAVGLQSRVRSLYAAYASVVDTHVANGRFFVTDGLDSALAGHFIHGGSEIVRALIGEPSGCKAGYQ